MLGRIALDINSHEFGKSFIENKSFKKEVGGSAVNTSVGLAFTEILPDGKTNLMMYRDKNVADLQLSTTDVDEAYIASAKCMIISGAALSASPSRDAAIKAIRAYVQKF